MSARGFTLIELMITLVVLTIIAGFALPNFSKLVRDTRTHTQAQELYQAAQLARTYAITGNERVTLRANGDWNHGWQVFKDPNHNGKLDAGEELLASGGPLHGTRIIGNQWVTNHISFIGTGESRFANGNPGGAFQAGTITVCGMEEEAGYKLVLARGGRMRMGAIEHDQCL